MDRIGILVAANRQLLESYSRRTTQSLRRAVPIPLALPWLERVLADNVAKEVRKDTLVIRSLSSLTAQQPPAAETLRTLLAATKQIDTDFLARVSRAPLGILIRYERIEPIRVRRIERLLTATQRIHEAWQGRCRLRAVLRLSYPDAEFERLVFDLLSLYAEETKVLAESVRLPLILAPLRQRIVQSLNLLMRDVARELASEWAAKVAASDRFFGR